MVAILTAVGMVAAYAFRMGGGAALAAQISSLAALGVGVAGFAFYIVRAVRQRRRGAASHA